MSLPLVSVIIPTHDRAYMLEKSLRSVMSQSYENIEVIVVDDYSNDNTFELVESLRREDKRIKPVRNKKHLGLPRSRNIGLLHSHGDLIFFSEDDLILSENMIETLVNTYLKLSPRLKVGAISPRLVLISRERLYVWLPECKYIVGLLNVLTGEPCFCYDIVSNWLLLAQHPPATSLVPKYVFDDIGVYYTGYKFNYIREDSDLYLRMLKKGYIFVYQPKAVAFHVTGFRGGCTVNNLFIKNLADLYNQMIYLIRGFGIKAIPMSLIWFLKKIPKLKYLKESEKMFTALTFIEMIGYRKALNDVLNKASYILMKLIKESTR